MLFLKRLIQKLTVFKHIFKSRDKIYRKVKYALHITGTAHSLLYDITTRLTNDKTIQIPISKVHKMVRGDNYYGLFSDKKNYLILRSFPTN